MDQNFIQITAKAVNKALFLAQKDGKAKVLRVGVKGGGCSGLSYFLDFEDQVPRENDLRFEQGGLMVICDPKSMQYLDGMVVDYHSDLLRGGFRFNNPNAKKSCSCGESFSV